MITLIRRLCLLAITCALHPLSVAHAQGAGAGQTLTGMPKLACEAILCLSSGLQPAQCGASLAQYFSIEIFTKGSLDWAATIDARQAFLSMCPVLSAAGMASRIEDIAHGAGRCDADYLNTRYAGTAYRYRIKSEYWDSGAASYVRTYEVVAIPTVTMASLPSYCVSYIQHAWTYELGLQYVGEPSKGGKWVETSAYPAAQAAWNASQANITGDWVYSWNDPRSHTVNPTDGGHFGTHGVGR